jgi:hypothetical protein
MMKMLITKIDNNVKHYRQIDNQKQTLQKTEKAESDYLSIGQLTPEQVQMQRQYARYFDSDQYSHSKKMGKKLRYLLRPITW